MNLLKQYMSLHKNVWIMSQSTGIIVIILHTWNVLLPLYLRELGASTFQISLSFASVALSGGLFQFWGGILSDRYGRKPMIVIPTLMSGILFFLVGFVRCWLPFVLIMVFSNIITSLQDPGIISIISESASPSKKGFAFGLFQFFIALSLAIGPGVGVVLLNFLQIPNLIRFTGLVIIMVAFWRFKRLSETRKKTIDIGKFKFKHCCKGKLLSLLLTGIFFISIMNLTINGPFMSIYSHDFLGLTNKQINLLFSIGPLFAMAISLVIGKLIEIFGSELVLSSSMMGMALFVLWWMLSRNYFQSVWTFSLAYLCFQGALISYDTLRIKVTSNYASGCALGAIGTVTSIVSAFAAPIAGSLIPCFGAESPFYLAAILAGGIAICCFKMRFDE